MIINCKTEQENYRFFSFDEAQKCIYYNDFLIMEILDYKQKDSNKIKHGNFALSIPNNFYFPYNLVGLTIKNSDLWYFPKNLPKTLECIRITKCRIHDVPDTLEHFIHLEELDLSYNDISLFITTLPPNIVSVILEGNNIKYVQYNEPDSLRSVDLGWYTETQKQSNILPTAPPLDDLIIIPQQTTTTAEDRQNVHDSSIQKSIRESCGVIMNYRRDVLYDDNFIISILREAKKRRKWYLFMFSTSLENDIIFYHKRNSMHGSLNVTFNHLLFRIWLIINDKNKDLRKEIVQVLFDEIKTAHNLCYTGLMSRMINSLVGFHEGLEVSISLEQEITNRSAAILNKNTKKYDENSNEFEENYRKEMKELLDSYNLTELQRKYWVDIVESVL